MSWLSDTLGKVREQGSSLVTAAKQVKHRLTSEQGDAQLESQALAAVAAGPNAVEQLCQAWSRQLNTAASVSGGDGISKDHFWQALLRSRAVESLLEGQHAQYAQHAGQSGQFDGTALRLLVSRVLPDDHAALGQELVTIITGERGDLASDEHTNFAAELISSSKVDSRSEALFAESLELRKSREKLVQELQKLSSGGESLDRPARRVEVSSELLGNFEASNQGLEEAGRHCIATSEARQQKITKLLGDIEAYAMSLEGSEGVGQTQNALQDKLRECHNALSAELAKIDKQRESSDRQIESLENKKLMIRQKLQSLDDKLHSAREVQRSCFEQRDLCRKAVADVEGQFRSQLREVEEEGLQARKEHDAAKKVRSAAVEAESLSSQALKAAADELEMKALQFDDHLLTVLMDHLEQEEQRIHQLAREAQHCQQVVQKHKAEIQMLNVMDRPANSVLDSQEHKRLRQTAAAVDVALRACATFVRDFGPFLDKDAEATARVRTLESHHGQVLQKLAPCREFLGSDLPFPGQPRTSTPTPPGQSPQQSPQQSPKQSPQQSPQAASQPVSPRATYGSQPNMGQISQPVQQSPQQAAASQPVSPRAAPGSQPNMGQIPQPVQQPAQQSPQQAAASQPVSPRAAPGSQPNMGQIPQPVQQPP